MIALNWLKEPLLHFLFIGAALFVLFYEVGAPVAERTDVITVSGQDLEQMSALWAKRWQRPPTSAELDGLVESRIREEVLYREAQALGLDQDDTIVRRRMTQKMEFLFGDLTTGTEPTDEELQAYLEANAERFLIAPRFSFMHVFLNSEKRGDMAMQDAELLLDDLRLQGVRADPFAVSDASLIDNRFDNVRDREISRMLGEQFATGVVKAPVGQWHGPVVSAYGVHLVFVGERQEARTPQLADIRDRVRTEVEAERRREANEAMYQQLRARYEIRIDRVTAPPVAGTGTSAR